LLPGFGILFKSREICIGGAQESLPAIPFKGPVQNGLHGPLLFLGELAKQLVRPRAYAALGVRGTDFML
jgi:hypothetical protein